MSILKVKVTNTTAVSVIIIRSSIIHMYKWAVLLPAAPNAELD